MAHRTAPISYCGTIGWIPTLLRN